MKKQLSAWVAVVALFAVAPVSASAQFTGPGEGQGCQSVFENATKPNEVAAEQSQENITRTFLRLCTPG